MKRKKTLLWMGGALVVLLIAFAVVSQIQPKTTTPEADTAQSLGEENLTSFTVTYEQPMTFVKIEEGWAYEADDTFPLDQDKAQAMAEVLENLSADKTIDAPSTDKTYGLDSPKCTVAFGEKILKIGSDDAMDGGRYFSLGDGKVYITSSDILSPFQYSMLDLVELQEAPMMENLAQVTLERKGMDTLVLKDRQSENLTYSEDYIWFYGSTPLDTETTEDLIRHGTDMTWEGCADYNAADLSAYGFDDPTLRLTIRGTGTYTLEVGDAVSGQYYAHMNDSRVIYWMDATDVNALLDADPANLYPNEVLLMDWDTVSSVTADLAGETWRFTSAARDKVSTEAGETVEEGEQETYWLLDGTEVSLGDVLTSVTDMTPTGSAAGATPTRAEELSLTVSREGREDVILCFYRDTAKTSLVTLNGESEVYVNRTDVVTLCEAITAIVLAE